MRSRSDFRIYQETMYRHVIRHPYNSLFAEMSTGKSAVTLAAINDLLDWCEVSKPLIVAPRLVAEMTWSDEIKVWDFLSHLKLSKIIGTATQRKKALTAEADIWIISRDNIAWLCQLLGAMWPFDMVILDESTSFKSHDSQRFRALRKIVDKGLIRRQIHLTGTPAPNGLMDLWAPLYLLDKGERLGTTITGFRTRYFIKNDYEFKYTLRPGAEASVHNAISDICISMRKEDWLELKPVEDVTYRVALPDMKQYKQFEEDAVLALEGAEITAVNAGSLYNKLLQFSNGAVYDAERDWHLVHDAKLDMLEEIIEGLNGEPVLIFYCFRSDIDRIERRIKGITRMDNVKALEAWNRKEVKIGLGHPASMGHGLNLQYGGHRLIWFGVPSALELYQQAIARLDRPGQEFPVVNMHLITAGTVEEKVVQRLVDKTLTQATLMEALKAFREEVLQDVVVAAEPVDLLA